MKQFMLIPSDNNSWGLYKQYTIVHTTANSWDDDILKSDIFRCINYYRGLYVWEIYTYKKQDSKLLDK